MADLTTANKVVKAIEPHFSEWGEKCKGQCLIAWMKDEEVNVQFQPSFDQAMEFQETLSDKERSGSVFREFPDAIMML